MSDWSMTRLYLGNLPADVTEKEIRDFFNEEVGHGGNITEVKIMDGFGFIQYDNPDDAKDTVPSFHGKEFKGKPLVVQFARGNRHHPQREFNPAGGAGQFPPRPRRTAHRMIISGLPLDTSWQDLKDFARKANDNVVYSDISRDRNGRGTVEFESAEDLKQAIDMLHESEFRGHTVSCTADDSGSVPPPSRSYGGGGGYGGGPRGRSMSPHRGGPGGYGGRRSGYSPPRYPSPRGGGGYRGGPGGRYEPSPPHGGGYRERSPRRSARDPYYGAPRDHSPRRAAPPVDDYPPVPPRGGYPREDYPPRRPYDEPAPYRGGGGRRDDYDRGGRYPSPPPRGRPSPPPRGGPPPRGAYDDYDRRRGY